MGRLAGRHRELTFTGLTDAGFDYREAHMKTNIEILKALVSSYCKDLPNPQLCEPFVKVINESFELCFVASDEVMKWSNTDKRSMRFSVLLFLLQKEIAKSYENNSTPSLDSKQKRNLDRTGSHAVFEEVSGRKTRTWEADCD
jgi:hypothetical protein